MKWDINAEYFNSVSLSSIFEKCSLHFSKISARMQILYRLLRITGTVSMIFGDVADIVQTKCVIFVAEIQL